MHYSLLGFISFRVRQKRVDMKYLQMQINDVGKKNWLYFLIVRIVLEFSEK